MVDAADLKSALRQEVPVRSPAVRTRLMTGTKVARPHTVRISDAYLKAMMITLFQQHDSGNCYKVRLMLAHRGVAYRAVAVSSLDGSTRQPAFLVRNPNGRVPTVELDDGRHLAELNAILLYFGEGSALVPGDAYNRAKMYEWLFFEQYNHEPAIAVRRALSVYPERRTEATAPRMAQLLEAGNRALAVMERRLSGAEWLAGAAFSLADISLYAYTHTAGQGGYALDRFPGISRWLARVAALPAHVSIEAGAP